MPKKAILSYSGDAERPDLFSFAKGEELTILGEFTTGWYVATRGDVEGFVPRKYFLMLKKTAESKTTSGAKGDKKTSASNFKKKQRKHVSLGLN